MCSCACCACALPVLACCRPWTAWHCSTSPARKSRSTSTGITTRRCRSVQRISSLLLCRGAVQGYMALACRICGDAGALRPPRLQVCGENLILVVRPIGLWSVIVRQENMDPGCCHALGYHRVSLHTCEAVVCAHSSTLPSPSTGLVCAHSSTLSHHHVPDLRT